MRVVLDTNVLVSGIFFGGVPGRVVDTWLGERFTACITPLIYEEYVRALEEIRLKFRPILEKDWPSLFPEICLMISDERHPKRISRDRSDDKFIYCARNVQADFLVTGDKDLMSLPQTFPFAIASPAKFLNQLPKKH